VLGRLGGDEFAVLLPETDENGATVSMKRLHEKLQEAMRAGGWPTTFSIGIAAFDNPPSSVDDMVCKADSIMYEVKMTEKIISSQGRSEKRCIVHGIRIKRFQAAAKIKTRARHHISCFPSKSLNLLPNNRITEQPDNIIAMHYALCTMHHYNVFAMNNYLQRARAPRPSSPADSLTCTRIFSRTACSAPSGSSSKKTTGVFFIKIRPMHLRTCSAGSAHRTSQF